MAKVRRLPLFEREIRERLSQAAIELLLGQAELLSEGQRARAGSGRDVYFGSTMLTVELGRAQGALRDPCDAVTARRVAELLAADDRVRARLRATALAEATRRAGVAPTRAEVDVRVRAQGTTIYIDLDVEGVLG